MPARFDCYVGRCPHCGVITAASRCPMTAKEVGRFAESVVATGRLFGTASNDEVRNSTFLHEDTCPMWRPKPMLQKTLVDAE